MQKIYVYLRVKCQKLVGDAAVLFKIIAKFFSLLVCIQDPQNIFIQY